MRQQQPDSSQADDRNRIAGPQRGGLQGVPAHRCRLNQHGIVIADVRWQGPGKLSWHNAIVSKTARFNDPENLFIRAYVPLSTPTVAALATGNVRLDDDALTKGKVAHPITRRVDIAHPLVARSDRVGGSFLPIAFIKMNIGATNTNHFQSNSHLTETWVRPRHLLKFNVVWLS
jgi:hypothetical protein